MESGHSGQRQAVATTAEQRWKIRHPEIVEDMSQEVYGFVPANSPKVKWSVKITDNEFIGRVPVIAKHIVGQVDNSSYPLIDINIDMVLVVPANVKGPVPVLMMFGQPAMPNPAQPSPNELETINQALRSILIKNDPTLEKILERYPAFQLVTSSSDPLVFGPTRMVVPTRPGINGTSNDPPGTTQLQRAAGTLCSRA